MKRRDRFSWTRDALLTLWRYQAEKRLLSLPREIRRGLKQYRADHRLLSEFIAPGDLVFDVGANTGVKTRVYLALGARVVAFEPQPACRAILEERFGQKVVIDPRALSDREGTAELQIPQLSTIASVAPKWIQAVTESGRFSDYAWSETHVVPTTRLETAISTYGLPAFCKIDVEGHEEAVVNGLQTPLPALSLEFTPEYRDSLVRSIERLATLANYEWNCVPLTDAGAGFHFARWMPPEEFAAFLRAYNYKEAADVYARLNA